MQVDVPVLKGPFLVTGAAGFIGHHLVRKLIQDGGQVRAIDDLSTGNRRRLNGYLHRLDFIEGSIADPDICRKACRNIRIIFHLAAVPSVHRSVKKPHLAHEANATGTLNLLEAARCAGVERIVYAGSSSAYGDTAELPKHERLSSRPLSPYAASKLAGEHYCQVYTHIHNLSTVVLRYFNVFGPGQDPSSAYAAVIPKFIKLALDEESPIIYGDGEQTRDFTYVGNVIEANVLAAAAVSADVSGKVFNVGCGQRISINRLWQKIRQLTGAWVEARYGPPQAGEVRDSLADIAAISKATGFVPLVELEEGLRRTVAWYRQMEEVVA